MFPFPRRMILGVTGGIAAYKSCELLRRLMDRGIEVTVVPTENALRFVGSATWEALTGKPVQSSLWSDVSSGAHIELARDAQLLVIAPATADFIARLAHGRSEDLLGATALTMQAPIIVIPAMHHQMWRNPATVANVATLRSRGILVMEPAEGPLNNGDSGVGRFPETFEILDFLQQSGFLRSDLVGKHVVVTAGGTREMIDPVRFIGNRSSGKQGIALAKAAASRGARVSLIAANVGEDLLPNDQSITLTKVESALQLANTLSKIESFDILLMTAAVADYRPVTASVTKLKRDGRRIPSSIPIPTVAYYFGPMEPGKILDIKVRRL
ncbi:MAG: bifunctional phosphopantothenoylcysteine decarboxylase/phosphopantothenate--cysteine ligase CoaBC [Actinobacteria bacterium]|nr:bifunctional phosphopantothenoylcysteine decarboxylase/phosphopantothenate--cysteine ligase CoaBC [Actinomycetota bacterium]